MGHSPINITKILLQSAKEFAQSTKSLSKSNNKIIETTKKLETVETSFLVST